MEGERKKISSEVSLSNQSCKLEMQVRKPKYCRCLEGFLCSETSPPIKCSSAESNHCLKKEVEVLCFSAPWVGNALLPSPLSPLARVQVLFHL